MQKIGKRTIFNRHMLFLIHLMSETCIIIIELLNICFLFMETEQEMNKLLKRHENAYINQLLLYLPQPYIKACTQQHNNYQKIVTVLHLISKDTKVDDDMNQFFREIGIDKKVWAKLDTAQERFTFIFKNLDKCIQEGQKKITTQIDNFVSNSRKSVTPSNKQNKRKDPFEWLKLKNKYPMCEQKLKAKLVQAISDIKNQNRIRQRMADPQNFPKVSLLDESLVLDEYEKMKIEYQWNDQDEKVFLSNIKELKEKFNKSQFLKTCSRFKFISAHELETLASEQISRRLDHNNKVFLSRQFLLDKYYSNRQFLTEQEMRFILKTSPLLSKCVDKQFIRNAIKNIDYEDINKLELKIAENIISRFDQIRKAVKDSRKQYKQNQNQVIKEKIVEFQKKKELEIAKEIARQHLKKHKIAIKKKHYSQKSINGTVNSQSKKVLQSFNQYHPPSGLFVKDCNQQCTDDLFNSYEIHYLEKDKSANLQKIGKNSISMMQFYSGGFQNRVPGISQQALDKICKVIKAHFYQKQLKTALENYEPQMLSQGTNRTGKSGKSIIKQMSSNDLEKKQKQAHKNVQQSSEAQIKKKILQNKQRAKAVIYVNKMLSLAAQNSYASFKALNAKLSVEQANAKDHKGNTALYYASKYQNFEFMNHLLNLGADPSIVCQKQFTPLHHIFKTNNVNLIIRCLCSAKTPNLNAVNSQGKTPLAYCTHDVLTRLNLQDGVVVVQNRKIRFDNNTLVSGQKMCKLKQRLNEQHLAVNRVGF